MRVLIADDHALFRGSLRSLLEARGVEVVGEASNGRAAFELARQLQPDVVLMDLAMPEVDGLAGTRLIAAALPAVKVVMLTGSEEDAQLFEAIKAGAQGYLLKNLDAESFLELLERTERGEPALTPAIARKLLQELSGPAKPAANDPDPLTEREREILGLLVAGVTSNRKLAKRLGISENTVKFHIRHLLDKLHVRDRAQMVGHALRHGLVDGPASY